MSLGHGRKPVRLHPNTTQRPHSARTRNFLADRWPSTHCTIMMPSDFYRVYLTVYEMHYINVMRQSDISIHMQIFSSSVQVIIRLSSLKLTLSLIFEFWLDFNLPHQRQSKCKMNTENSFDYCLTAPTREIMSYKTNFNCVTCETNVRASFWTLCFKCSHGKVVNYSMGSASESRYKHTGFSEVWEAQVYLVLLLIVYAKWPFDVPTAATDRL